MMEPTYTSMMHQLTYKTWFCFIHDSGGQLRVYGSIASSLGDGSQYKCWWSSVSKLHSNVIGSNSNVKWYSGTWCYILEICYDGAGPTSWEHVLYVGNLQSSSSSNLLVQRWRMSLYYSGHWGQYLTVRVWMQMVSGIMVIKFGI